MAGSLTSTHISLSPSAELSPGPREDCFKTSIFCTTAFVPRPTLLHPRVSKASNRVFFVFSVMWAYKVCTRSISTSLALLNRLAWKATEWWNGERVED